MQQNYGRSVEASGGGRVIMPSLAGILCAGGGVEWIRFEHEGVHLGEAPVVSVSTCG